MAVEKLGSGDYSVELVVVVVATISRSRKKWGPMNGVRAVVDGGCDCLVDPSDDDLVIGAAVAGGHDVVGVGFVAARAAIALIAPGSAAAAAVD